jgi:dihydrofolate reductase
MIIAEFLKNDLIDEFIISIHPVLLGIFIHYSKRYQEKKKLKFIDVRAFNSGLGAGILYKEWYLNRPAGTLICGSAA